MKNMWLLPLVALCFQTAHARPGDEFPGANNNEPKKNECSTSKMTMPQIMNGMILRGRVGEKVRAIVQDEKNQGRNPKVFVIGRVGQDFSGVKTLKDIHNGKNITVKDIFSDINPNFYTTDGGSIKVAEVQNAIKKKYTDTQRQILYSHVGLLFIDHPAVHGPVVFDGKTIQGGEFWVEELLKPCANLEPRAWVTGLAQFFEDDPHDYRSIIMVPEQEIQDRLYDLLVTKDRAKDFLGQTYNAASHYNNKTEQNSNQYVLELLGAAQSPNYGTIRRTETHEILKKTGYRPTKIIGDSLKASFITSWFAPNSMKINDNENPYARPYNVSEFITELSLREYMIRAKLLKPSNIHEVYLPIENRIKEEQKIEVRILNNP